ncbi:MAG: hypothetical protein KAT44_13630, partial [Pirellulales bacterium]|nr:hypothetical protein [Pirellulales bacterium]
IGLRNRRLLVRIQWGVLQLIKVVETHFGGLFLFQFGRPKCNEIKGLAMPFDSSLKKASQPNDTTTQGGPFFTPLR